MSKPHPLDGVRPKHAICASCRYEFGGVAIKGGVIVCPECGKATPFDFASHATEIERLRARIRVRRIVALLVTALAVLCFTLVGVKLGW